MIIGDAQICRPIVWARGSGTEGSMPDSLMCRHMEESCIEDAASQTDKKPRTRGKRGGRRRTGGGIVKDSSIEVNSSIEKGPRKHRKPGNRKRGGNLAKQGYWQKQQLAPVVAGNVRSGPRGRLGRRVAVKRFRDSRCPTLESMVIFRLSSVLSSERRTRLAR